MCRFGRKEKNHYGEPSNACFHVADDPKYLSKSSANGAQQKTNLSEKKPWKVVRGNEA
jgi:hypothetical protein